MIFEGRKPLKRVSDRKRMVSEADKLIRKLVMARDGNRCVRCGKSGTLQAAHLFSKGRWTRLRFELLNVVSLCYACHFHFWHKQPLQAAEWLEDKYPGRTEQLGTMAATASRPDMKELVIALRMEAKDV